MSQIERATGNKTALPLIRFDVHVFENADRGVSDVVRNDPSQRKMQTTQDEEQRDLPNGKAEDAPDGGKRWCRGYLWQAGQHDQSHLRGIHRQAHDGRLLSRPGRKGYWAHGGSAGPFDTGSRVGSNIQLIGKIRIPCDPAKFSLAQTVTYTKAIFNGVHDPKEGVAQDDIAKSGRNFSRPPSRQERSDDISMADPPSTEYSSGATSLASDIEWDRSFTTSLVGPAGKESLDWSTSMKVDQGKVVRNTIS